MKIEITKGNLDQVFSNLFNQKAPPSYMIGLRGCLTTKNSVVETNDNKPYYNNDTVGLVFENSVKLFKGTIEPGYEWTQRSARSGYPGGGCFHLGDGLHDAHKGMHQGKYEAFRVDNAKGWRDRNQNGAFDSKDIYVSITEGINVHRGASGDWIGLNSAGCTNILASYWPQFKNLGYQKLNQQFKYWTIHSRTLNDAIQDLRKRPVKIQINGKELEPDVEAWLENGSTVVGIRSFLTQVFLNSKPIEWIYQPKPDRVIIKKDGKDIEIKINIVNSSGVALLRDILPVLDKDVEIGWDASRIALIESKILSVQKRQDKMMTMNFIENEGEFVPNFEEVKEN